MPLSKVSRQWTDSFSQRSKLSVSYIELDVQVPESLANVRSPSHIILFLFSISKKEYTVLHTVTLLLQIDCHPSWIWNTKSFLWETIGTLTPCRRLFLSIPIVLVSLRFCVRARMVKKICWDDFFLLFWLVRASVTIVLQCFNYLELFSIAVFGIVITCMNSEAGRHVYYISPKHLFIKSYKE